MKRRLLIGILSTFAVAFAALGVSLEWASNPPGEKVRYYTVYAHIGSNYTALATVTPTPSVSPSWVLPSPLPSGTPSYAVTATDNFGMESGKSTDVTLPLPPSVPTGVVLVP